MFYLKKMFALFSFIICGVSNISFSSDVEMADFNYHHRMKDVNIGVDTQESADDQEGMCAGCCMNRSSQICSGASSYAGLHGQIASRSCCSNIQTPCIPSLNDCCPNQESIVACQNSASLGYANLSNDCKMCLGFTLGGSVIAGIIFGILAVTGDGDFNNYHVINVANKPIALHIRGASYNCRDTYYTTDSKGKRTQHSVPKDCRRYVYPGDRITLRNYGHLTKLGAKLWDPLWDYEFGTYEHVTNEGLKDLDWVVHRPGRDLVFTRQSDQALLDSYTLREINDTCMDQVNATCVAQQADNFRSYHQETFAPAYQNLRGTR